MGGRTQAVEEVDERSIGSRGADDSNIRKGKPGRRPEPEPRPIDAAEALRHAKSIFPFFIAWLKAIRDPRKRPDMATFPVDYLLLMALLMFCGQCGSRRRLGKALTGGKLPANIWRMVGKQYNARCHVDTMNNVMEGIDPEALEGLIVKIVGQLRVRKMLRRFKVDGKFVVAFDGTQIFRVSKPVGEGWLTQTKDGKTTYSRYVLAAKIVTSAGLVVPFAFEFVENPANGVFNKQDCELKACRRLMDKIHRLYPRMRVAMVGDALFAEETTFLRCAELEWDFFITLKDGKLPTVGRQLPESGALWPEDRRVDAIVSINDRKEMGEHLVRWKSPITYHHETYHVIDFTEFAQNGTKIYHNTWITNVKPNKTNALELALHARLRWKIENEGINTQKNGGYEMEHAYGHKKNAWKNYYLILQVGQLFNDLVRYTDITTTLADDVRSTFARLYGSMAEFAARLLASLQRSLLSDQPLWRGNEVQIRFTAS
jgi:hypothetical protein